MRWRLLTAVAVLLAGAVVWWVTGRDCSSDAASVGSPVVTDTAAAEEYWTADRMASARPVEMPVERAVRHCRNPF